MMTDSQAKNCKGAALVGSQVGGVLGRMGRVGTSVALTVMLTAMMPAASMASVGGQPTGDVATGAVGALERAALQQAGEDVGFGEDVDAQGSLEAMQAADPQAAPEMVFASEAIAEEGEFDQEAFDEFMMALGEYAQLQDAQDAAQAELDAAQAAYDEAKDLARSAQSVYDGLMASVDGDALTQEAEASQDSSNEEYLAAQDALADAQAQAADAESALVAAQGSQSASDAALADAQAQLASAQSAIDAQAGEDPDATDAQAQLASAQQAVDAAQSMVAASQAEVASAQLAYDAALQAQASAQASLDAAQPVIQSAPAVPEAGASQADFDGAKADLDVANATLAKAESDLDRAQAKLASATSAASKSASSGDFRTWRGAASFFNHAGFSAAYDLMVKGSKSSYFKDTVWDKNTTFDKGGIGDATSVANLLSTAKYIKAINDARLKEGKDPVTGKALKRLKVSPELVAQAMLICNKTAANTARTGKLAHVHTNHFGLSSWGENLAASTGGSYDPVAGWMSEKSDWLKLKAKYPKLSAANLKAKADSLNIKVGHYLIMCSSNYDSVGFARSQKGGNYSNVYCAEFSSGMKDKMTRTAWKDITDSYQGFLNKYDGKVSSFKGVPISASLKTTSYTYDGNSKKPSVKVTSDTGACAYSASYASGRTKVGTYTVTIKGTGLYSGTITRTFTINPKGTSLTTVSAGSKSFTAKWSKQSTQTTGYEVRYSTKSDMSGAKSVKVSGTSKKITGLTKGKKYYVQVRTYKNVGGKTYCSGWSAKKSVTSK